MDSILLNEREFLRAAVSRMGGTAAMFVYGLSPVSGIGVFRVPKNGNARNQNPPAMQARQQPLCLGAGGGDL